MRAKSLGIFSLVLLSLTLGLFLDALSYKGLTASFDNFYGFMTDSTTFVFLFFFISIFHLSYYLIKEEEFELPLSFVLLVLLFALRSVPEIIKSTSSLIIKIEWIDLNFWIITALIMKLFYVILLIILLLFCFRFLTTGKEISFQWPFGKN